MAWTNLPTNYTDASWSGNRKYQQITNSDGTVSFVDKTVYTNKENSFFGAKDANQTNDGINQAMAQLVSMDTAYKAADSDLQSLLNTEISNRTSGDNNLQTNYKNLYNFVSTNGLSYQENIDWREWRKNHFMIYRYEGENWADLYAFPINNCFMMVIRNATRGVAMCFRWPATSSTNSKLSFSDNKANKYRAWLTYLHDDTGTNQWSGYWYMLSHSLSVFRL